MIVLAWLALAAALLFATVDAGALLRGEGLAWHHHIDLLVYQAGGHAALSGETYYDQIFAVDGTQLPFTYPPFAALVFTPLAPLPWQLAALVWNAATLAALWWCIRLLVRDPRTAVLLTAAAAWTEPLTENLSFAQINVFLAALVLSDALFITAHPSPSVARWRGWLTGVAMAIKLTPAVFLAYFFARRDWRGVAGGIGSFVACSVVGLLPRPDNSLEYWTATLRDSERIGALAYAGNQSLRGFVERLGLGEGWWLLGVAVLGVVLAVALFIRLREPAALVLVTSLAALLGSPVSWSHHFVWFVLLAVFFTARRNWWLAVPTWIVLFARGHWLVPHAHDFEYGWSGWQMLPGNDYLAWGGVLALCAALAPQFFERRQARRDHRPARDRDLLYEPQR